MKKLIALAAIALLAVAASCKTKNIGGPPVFFNVTINSVVPADPAGLFGNEDATFNASVTGGVAPYTYSWNFGGASTPNVSASPSGATTSITQTLTPSDSDQTYTVTVTATDAVGTSVSASTVINVGATRNAAPVVESATYNNATRVLTVSVSDPDDGETLTVTVAPSAGLSVDATSKQAAATGPLTATFNVSADDIIAGATGTIAVSVSDGTATTNAANPVAVTIPEIAVPADTLVAIPTSSSAAIGAEVLVVFVTGVTANAFQYMVGAGLTIENDADYVRNSFDAGVPDDTPDIGAVNGVDGIWAAMNPAGGFLVAPDNFIQPTDLSAANPLVAPADQQPGRERWDFNITPLSGSNLNGQGGVLFNARFTFDTAGVKTFGFQQTQGVKRTYYADDATEFFWGDIANDGTVGPNTVTIN